MGFAHASLGHFRLQQCPCRRGFRRDGCECNVSPSLYLSKRLLHIVLLSSSPLTSRPMYRLGSLGCVRAAAQQPTRVFARHLHLESSGAAQLLSQVCLPCLLTPESLLTIPEPSQHCLYRDRDRWTAVQAVCLASLPRSHTRGRWNGRQAVRPQAGCVVVRPSSDRHLVRRRGCSCVSACGRPRRSPRSLGGMAGQRAAARYWNTEGWRPRSAVVSRAEQSRVDGCTRGF